MNRIKIYIKRKLEEPYFQKYKKLKNKSKNKFNIFILFLISEKLNRIILIVALIKKTLHSVQFK